MCPNTGWYTGLNVTKKANCRGGGGAGQISSQPLPYPHFVAFELGVAHNFWLRPPPLRDRGQIPKFDKNLWATPKSRAKKWG